MEYRKKVSEPWFSLIKNGEKTVEGRLDKGDWGRMEEREKIIFFNNNEEFKVRINSIKKYKSIEKMIISEKLKNILPGIRTIKEGVKIYEDPPINFNEEKQKMYGVIAIKFTII